MSRDTPRVADDHRVRMDQARLLRDRALLLLRLQTELADVTIEDDDACASFKKPTDQTPSKKETDLFSDAGE
jgi:hypothetical protein